MILGMRECGTIRHPCQCCYSIRDPPRTEPVSRYPSATWLAPPIDSASIKMNVGLIRLSFVVCLGVTALLAAPPDDDSTAFDEQSSFLEADILPGKYVSRMAVWDNERYWPGGVMPYKINFNIDENVFLYNNILAAISIINEVECVNLVMAGSGAEDYVTISLGDEYASHVGKQGGEQEIIVSWENNNKGVIMHEIMHTLGFGHEHNRPDRNQSITVYWDNIKEEAKPYFTIYTPKMGYEFEGLPYDYTSLLHATSQYNPDVVIDRNKPVITRNDGGIELGQRYKLTDLDKARLRWAYNCNVCDNPENDNKLFRYPGDCTKYYHCSNYRQIPMNCPAGLHFHVNANYCDYPNLAECTALDEK